MLQPEELSVWFVLTLSAEQAVKDEDFDHLDVLLRRREEILADWDQRNLKIGGSQQIAIEKAEHRLTMAMLDMRNRLGAERKAASRQRAAAVLYKASA